MMLNESIFEEYSEWSYVSSKDVRDTDGFVTDYTWYKRVNNAGGEEHIFIFGDSDIYGPYDSTPDYETDSEERAQEWFDNYRGFDDDDLDEGLNYKDFDSFKKIADEIGLKDAGDIERFRKEYVEEGESDLEAIKRYRAELGDDFEITESKDKQSPMSKESNLTSKKGNVYRIFKEAGYGRIPTFCDLNSSKTAYRCKVFANSVEELDKKKERLQTAAGNLGIDVQFSENTVDHQFRGDVPMFRIVVPVYNNDSASDDKLTESQDKVEVRDPKLVSESLTDNSSLEKLCSDHNLICDELTEDDLESFGIDELMNMYEGDVTYYCIDTGEGQQVVVAFSDEGRITIEEDTDELGFGIGDEYKNAQVFMKSYLKYVGKEELEEALPAIVGAAITAAASGAGARLVDKIFGESISEDGSGEDTETLTERYLSGRYVWCEYKDIEGMNIYQLCKYIEELYKDKFRREVKVTDAIDQSYDYHNKELPFIVEADLGDEESVKGCDGFWFIVNCTEDEAKKLQEADLNESASDLETKKTVLNQLRDDLRLLLTCETLVDVEKFNDKFNVFDALNTVKNNIENGMSEEDAVIDAQSYLMQRVATLQREITSSKNASINPVNESVESESKYVYFFPHVGARQLTKEQALKMARDKLKLMEESSGAGEVGQGFAIYCIESTDDADTWTARNDAKEFIKSLTESFDVDKVQKRIASTSEFDNGYVFFDYEKMTSDEAEKKAKQISIDDPTRVFYVKYDDIMNPSSDIFWKNGEQVDYRGRKLEQPVANLQEGRMKELATEIENEGGKDKWLSAMSKRIAEMREMLSYLKNEAPREVNRGGNFDSYEELSEAVADIEKELDELLVKVQAIA